jgi:putrescine aminotransferase
MSQSRLWHPFADMGAVAENELIIDRGEDVWVFDREGRRYLDGTASLWYAAVGHGRREIADAVHTQMQRLEAYSAFGDFATEPAVRLAETLSDLAPIPSKVFLASGGGDGVDTAAKLARRYWFETGHPDRTLLISRTAGYHGTHGFGTALAGIPANRTGFGPQVHTVQVPHDSLEQVEQEIERIGADTVAGIFLEPVIGAGGVYPPVPGYIEGVAEICKRTGILLIIDSVICGFGRLGTWFGIERWPGVEPDMIVFAKGVTSGYLPLGGVVIHDRVAEPFYAAPGGPMLRHGATYSAHTSCCAAALANLQILDSEGLIPRGRELEQPLLEALKPLEDNGNVAEVRGGMGFLAAVELGDSLLKERPSAVAEVVAAARAEGVLVRGLGKGIAVSPPLTATHEHIEMIGEAVARAVTGLASVGSPHR